MWRQWEVEKGLTMMVTDDYIRRRMRMDEYPGPSGHASLHTNKPEYSMKELQKQKQAARESFKEQSNYWNRKLMEIEEKDPDRWGHSGYKELYPEEFTDACPSAKKRKKLDKAKKHKKHKKHKHRKKRSRRASSDDDNEIRNVVERKDKKGMKKNLQLSSQSSTSSDSLEKPRYRIGSLYMDHEQRYKRTPSGNSTSSSSDEWAQSDAFTQKRTKGRSEDNSCCSYNWESDASETTLENRREYLKRKLAEFSEDSSSDCIVISDDNEPAVKPTLHRIVKTVPNCPNGVLQNWRHRRKLKSQIVNGSCGRVVTHNPESNDST